LTFKKLTTNGRIRKTTAYVKEAENEEGSAKIRTRAVNIKNEGARTRKDRFAKIG